MDAASIRRSKRPRPPPVPAAPTPASPDSDFDDPTPRTKRKRIPTARVVEDHSLIDIVKSNGRLIPYAVKRLTEKYETEPKPVMVEILTMFFEACGAKYQLDVSSLDETDVDDVVVSLVEMARNGEVEDNYSSKRKELKNFKENLLLFWDKLVFECQNGPLFDKVLFEKCMDYVIALSCTPPRVYRQVASLVGLQLVTSFITVARTLAGQRETTQRQLNAEKKKRQDGPRVESLNKRLSLTHETITVTEEMMRKIFTGLFMHRYRDVDPEIRMSCIKSLGVWILMYPSLFLQDLYLKYLGWTLNDKNAGVRKTSVLALQSLYEVDDNVPSLGLFTERFGNRMIELADDIDISVAVSAICLLKQLLRHQLISDDELGPLYDLLIDQPPMIRRAIGELVYDHLIAQKVKSSQSGGEGGDDESPEIHLGRLLQILREFPDDPILIAYVIDDVWDDMKAMRDWKCIISMLLDENPNIELTDVDATNLVRMLHASTRKAVGEKIVPATDNRKQYYTKAQKEALENSRREITTAMMKSLPQLLGKYITDKAKVSSLVGIIVHLKLDLYSLKRQEQNLKTVLELITDAIFKHGDRDTLRSCIKALTFCSIESQGDLQDHAQNKLKDLEDGLIVKLKSAMKEVAMGDDEYSLLVNLKRLYEFQLTKPVSNDDLYEGMSNILRDVKGIENEVTAFLLLNMFLHVAWCLQSTDDESSSEVSIASLVSKRTTLFVQLEYYANTLLEGHNEGKSGKLLSARVCMILAELWCLFKNSKFTSTKLETLGYSPDKDILQKFWRLCEQQFSISDETEDEDANEEYIEETNGDAVMVAAAKLIASGTVPKAYRRHVVELTKRHDDSLSGKSFSDCKDLANRLSGTFVGAARNKCKSDILKIVKQGILFAFVDPPRQLSFLEGAVLPFISKLTPSDVLDILKDVRKRSENVNTDEDPSGWRPYFTFVDYLTEKYTKNEGLQDEKDGTGKRRGRPRKARNIQGKKLFDEQGSSEEDSISGSDHNDQDGVGDGEEDEDEEQQPLIHTFRSSASKLRSMRIPQQETNSQAGTSRTAGSNV